jgi:hypothetical protein
MIRTFLWSSVMLLALCLIGHNDALAGHHYSHRQKTCGKPGFKAYRYQHDNARESNSVLAFADEQAEITLIDSNGISEKTTRKRYHVPVAGVQADQVKLEKIGLTILSTGQAIFSGTLNHDGGSDGSLRGSHVIVSVRAYAGIAQDPQRIDALMIWETTEKAWVTRSRPSLIQFGTDGSTDSRLKRFFPEISHLELQVEYIADR